MKHISLFTKDYKLDPMKGISNERQLLVYEFLTPLNDQRVTDGFKPLTPSFVALKMSHLKLFELKMFLGECKKARHFGKFWWWSLKPNNNENQQQSRTKTENKGNQ